MMSLEERFEIDLDHDCYSHGLAYLQERCHPIRIMTDLVLSVLMLAGAALLGGGIYLIRSKKNTKQGILMIVASLVMFGNVGIQSIPISDENNPVQAD